MNPETQRIFEELATQRGGVTAEQMAEARRSQAGTGSGEAARSLLDVLIEKGYGDAAKLRDLAHAAVLRSGSERVEIGGFELLERIGEGGMGAVYRARQVAADRIVALKLMKPKLARDTHHLERFLREAKASARLSHPNIVQGIDAGDDKGYYYFAMEFVEGDTLKEVVKRDGALPEERCVRIAIDMARALEHVARHGTVHRDVKPGNIIIDRPTGAAKLADLGLAKSTESLDTSVTQVGMAIGTPNYINPEQARGSREIDIRSDIYSLGATMYHAATGTLPFEGESAPVIMSMHMSEPLEAPDKRNPGLSAGFSLVIQKMMAKNKDDRYQTPAKLLADLERVARGEPPQAALPRAASRGPAVSAAGRRKSAAPLVLIGSAAAILLLAGLAAIYGLNQRGHHHTNEATAAIHYTRAAQLVIADPMNFREIIERLDLCIKADPNGPKAKAANSLMKTAKSFRTLAGAPAKTPADWAMKARALTNLADLTPKDSPYAKGIRDYLRERSRKHTSAAIGQAIAEPIQVPEASAWLDAVIAWAPDEDTANAARAGRRELAKVLRENADYILDTFAKRAEPAAEKEQFKQAVAIVRSSVPRQLITPQLRELIEKKIAVIHEAADRAASRLEKDVWAMLDRGEIEPAASRVQWGRARLDLPHLEPKIAELARTVGRAGKFLPLLEELRKLEESGTADKLAVAAAALKTRDAFREDAYVADRLKKYGPAIRWLEERGRAAEQLKGIADLITGNKFAEADAAIPKFLEHPGLTKEERTAALAMRVRFAPEYALAKLLSTALEPRLPARNIYLKLKSRGTSLQCDIIGVSMQYLKIKTTTDEQTIPWGDLQAGSFHALALDRFQAVAPDDAYGQYHLAVLLEAEQHKNAKELLLRVAGLVESRTEADLPGRAIMLAETQRLLGRVSEAEAEPAMKKLAELVRLVDKPNELEHALAAHALFKKQYGSTQYVADNEKTLAKIEMTLVEAVLKDRTAPIVSMIKKHEWRDIMLRLKDAVAEVEKVGPVPAERMNVIAALLSFGEKYLAEEEIYREVFSLQPWQGERLKALKRSEDELVARRAERYSEFFQVKVTKQKSASEQERYAQYEWNSKGKNYVPVKNVNVRIARHNAVFTYWPQARDEGAWAEVKAATDFAQTAITDKDGKEIQNTGDFMLIIMAQNFLKYRGQAPPNARAEMEYQRLTAYARTAEESRLLRLYIAGQAKQAMYDHRAITDHPARFCLIAADQYAAADDLTNAHNYYDRLCSSRTKYKDFVWRGYLGRGRVYEHRKKYTAAVSDYEDALIRSSNWWDKYSCAKAITELCLHSGKFDRPTFARKAVAELVKRAAKGEGGDYQRKKALELLKPRENVEKQGGRERQEEG
ncbi:MAG: serine/threonine-protein kinase [Planctomycetota bacterium]